MTPLDLLDALCAFLRGEFASSRFATKDGSTRAPTVYVGDLPYLVGGTVDGDSMYPYIIVAANGARYPAINQPNKPATCSVSILVGTYDKTPDRQGYRDAVLMAETIIGAIKRVGTLARKYQLDVNSEMEWTFPSEQPYPHWLGVLSSNWVVLNPVQDRKEVTYCLPTRKPGA